MELSKKTTRINPIVLILVLGLVAFVLYLYFFINPAKVMEILSRTNLVVYSFAFIAYSLYALFSSLVWHRLLVNLEANVRRRKTLLLTWVGLFFEATVPQLGWSGEISKTYLLSKDSDVDSGTIFASVVGQKILTLTMSVVALGAGLGLTLINYPLPFSSGALVLAIFAFSILGLGIIFYVSFKPAATKKLLNWGIKVALFFRKQWNPKIFQSKAEELLENFHMGIRKFSSSPKSLLKPVVYAVASFSCEVSVVLIVFMSLSYPVPIDKVLIVFTVTGALQTVGVSIFGFAEIVMTSSFAFLGIPIDTSFSVTLLARVVNLWFRLGVSYFALQYTGIKIIRQNKNHG